MDIPQTWEGRRLRWCWPYHDEAGEPLNFRVARFDKPDDPGDKVCVPFKPNGAGWKAGALPEPRPLYGLNWLPAARERGSAVLVVEGEKKAAALHSLGFPAVSVQGGSKATGKADWTPLNGVPRVYLLPDNDEPGWHYARTVCEALAALERPPECLLVELPGLPPAGDVCDWLAARLPGWDQFAPVPESERDRLADELRAAIKAASRPPPPEWTGTDWPDPEPLPDARPAVLAFDDALLPDVLRPWVLDIAERMQCPPDYPAACVMVAAGSLIGRRLGIRPKARDDWLIVPNLWGAIVGPPGWMKTPALAEALRPLHRLAAEAAEQYQTELEAWTIEKHRRDAERQQKKAKMKGSKNPVELDALARELFEFDKADDSPPPERRYLTNDATVEKLSELLADNPAGILALRDELTGWLRDLDRPGREGSRAFYLETWNGTGSFVVDRIGRGTVRVPAACVSVLGSIQPGPLADYVYGALTEGGGADGLLQRFQVLVWPDERPGWRDVDRWPDSTARNAAFEAFARLAGLEPLAIGAQAPDDDRGIPYLRFDDAAQALFREWRTDLERRIKGEGAEALQGHLAKYRKLCPALALVAHLLDVGSGPVGERAMLQAAGWCEYLESHARRLYGASVAPEATAARLLAAKLSELPDPFTARDVYARKWSGLDRERVELAVSELAELKWLRPERMTTGGRPSIRFHVMHCRGPA